MKKGMVVAGGAGKDVRIYGNGEIGRICGGNPWYAVDWGHDAKTVAMGGTGGEVYEFFV